MRKLIVAIFVAAVAVPVYAAQEVKILQDFEDENDLKAWVFKDQNDYFKDKAQFVQSLTDQHATHGQKCLKIAPNEYMNSWKLPKDWSGYDSLEIDFFVEGDGNVGVSLLIGDADWQKKSSYWNRHNGGFNLKPGQNTASIPVNGLYRGEAGSRGNDLKTNINPKEITRFDMGFNAKGGAVTAIYMDNVRLVKETRPDGILAFDFGPESQTLFPGFTAISWNTVYGKDGNKAGLKKVCGHPNRARDDTFPTRLYQDFVWFQEDNNEFIADVPNGKYHVWLVFDDCGYWGGENCKHHKRTITAEGKEAWVDDRGENGPADYLFRFENIEPKPGDSLWDLYVRDLFKPVRFETEVADGQLNISLTADAPWSCKVAAIIVYPDSIKADAEKWVAEVEDRNRKEFEARAIFVGPKPKQLEIPKDAQTAGWWLGFPSLEEDVMCVDAPGKADGKLNRLAAKGQRISLTFAVRPLKDFGDVKLTATALAKSNTETIPASNIDLRYVMHGSQRGFNDIAYTIEPVSLRRVDGSGLKLTKDFTRQFWVTVSVPSDAPPGTYVGEATLTAGALKQKVMFTVTVLDFTLDEPDYVMGFYGTHVPAELPDARRSNGYRELFTMLRQNGMNSFTGGPDIRFSGFDAEGKPQIDYSACDEFFKAAKECGFTKAIMSYGGPGMVQGLHDGYVIGNTGRGWAQKTGKPFTEVLKMVWGPVKEHAEKEGWPPILYGFNDEPRVIENAQEQLELQKAYREAVPFVNIGGSYSVNWGNDPLEKVIQETFKTLAWSALNSHSQVDIDKAKEFGRALYIYNQGITRYSFGAYQWAEMQKGVRGRMQWHLLALHGYQFFDLDGREPDTAMINWGRSEIIPTINLPRCREGADDFRFAVTLFNLAQKKKDTAVAKAALAWLEEVNQKIGVAQRNRPQGLMDDETFRVTCIDYIRRLQALK